MQLGPLPRRAALFASLLLAGCASTPRIGGDPNLKVIEASALPAPDRMDLTTGARDYFVGPFDRLTIDVFGVPELSGREVQVDASGRISFPLVGALAVAGHSPGEVESLLAGRLRVAHVRDPQVTVNLKETVSQVVTIEGQVRKPGLYPVVGHMSLMRAMALAEGTDEYARLDDVVIFRTVKGQRLAALYDLNAIRHGVYPDPEVFANDVVMVGDSSARRLFKDVLSVVPALATPIIIGVDRLSK
ncbi:polysaccharide export protein [Croceicoccus estronivorus]|uniref:polysaccharide biosynthesis/export family protein n=1 Tax=Croceicoccus estronivorus TaxID=1172626 RepID=UPI00082D5C7C|nr:polysaccharide biosynthesis/export family protein [Croceicoccus estronivorus]OCC22911.1 polysaccharide export protein [Croceicoccus estronivorus]